MLNSITEPFTLALHFLERDKSFIMAIMISDIDYSESWVVLMTNSGITQVSWKDSLRKGGGAINTWWTFLQDARAK